MGYCCRHTEAMPAQKKTVVVTVCKVYTCFAAYFYLVGMQCLNGVFACFFAVFLNKRYTCLCLFQYGLMFNILRETVIGEYGAHYWREIWCVCVLVCVRVDCLHIGHTGHMRNCFPHTTACIHSVYRREGLSC